LRLILTRALNQRLSTASFNSVFQQHLSTAPFNSVFQPRLSTAPFNSAFQQRLSTAPYLGALSRRPVVGCRQRLMPRTCPHHTLKNLS
jgi:hypothetical protein